MNINHEVALKVMGWHLSDDGMWVDENNEAHDPRIDFQECIQSAWLVVERMRELGYGMIIDMFDDWVAVRFYQGGVGAPSGDSQQLSSASLAICQAALKALA